MNGTYTKSLPLNDAAGNPIVTDSNGVAKLKLKPGKYYISAEKEYAENGLLVRNLMPWLEVTVICEEHTYQEGKCTVCGAIDENYKPDNDNMETDADVQDTPSDEATDTGDDFNALLFGIIALTAFAAAAATVFYRRKTN